VVAASGEQERIEEMPESGLAVEQRALGGTKG
jgi:hypothetical protein